MAGVEPYSPCPCGSGQKFKWCCHKVEVFADKAQRLFDGNQTDAAIKVVDEGLQKEPGSAWLLTRKAIMLITQGQAEPAKAVLRQVLQKNPKHLGALVLLTRCILESEGPVNGAGMFQQVLANTDEAIWPQLEPLARVVGLMLLQAAMFPAAIKHLQLVTQLGDPDKSAVSALRNIDSSTSVSAWLKDRLSLASPPAEIDPSARERFEHALEQANKGLWASAAATFDQLASHAPGSEADYNLGVCRLWLGDEAGSIDPIRRRSKLLGPSIEAVDLEILVQNLEPIQPEDRIERVQLTWPLRNREALLATLRSVPDISDEGQTPLDPNDPESAEVDLFLLLDRPAINGPVDQPLTPDLIPLVLGRIMVDQKTVALEAYDDGRVDSLGDRFTALGASAIAPAHPRTKILGEEARSSLALSWEWLYPSEITRTEADRLNREQQAHIISEVWPVTPMPYLGFRTPTQAAKDGDAEIPLRAALCFFELDQVAPPVDPRILGLRARLNVPAEPAIDPATVDVSRVALGRLVSIPADQLNDDQLILLYRRARTALALAVLENAARALILRPQLFETGRIDPVSVYSDLASLAISRGEVEAARSLLAQGRQADPPSRKAANAPVWDMIEVRQRARSEPPEVWVPELAIIFDRYSEEPTANQVIMLNLVELGLIQLSPNPEDPQDLIVDSRPLQGLMARYGPKVTTASGRLGVSAAKPEVWTPGGSGGSTSGGIWTPGSGPAGAPAGDKPKLILPGR